VTTYQLPRAGHVGCAGPTGQVVPPHQQGRVAVQHPRPRLAHLGLHLGRYRTAGTMPLRSSLDHSPLTAQVCFSLCASHLSSLITCHARRGIHVTPHFPVLAHAGLKAALALAEIGPDVGPPLPAERLYNAVNVIMSYQNHDGGWATYENTRSFHALEVRSSALHLHR